MCAVKNTKIKVLVVDDEEVIRDLSKELMEYLGYDYISAEDGYEAQEIVHIQNPDVVILDLNMPKLSGEKTLMNLMEKYPDLRVLISTGEVLGDSEIDDLTAKGAFGFVKKPFSIADLNSIILEAAGR